MTAVCMIYGATGFTGRLILDAVLARGLRPVIAGRTEEAVRVLAARHQLPYRAFSLDDPDVAAEALEDVDVVLNAAGPFSATAEPLARLCIAHGVHYLDIGCERRVLERLGELDGLARNAEVTLLSGLGFSPAAGEALAGHLKRRLPGAVKLVIALSAPVPPSPGLVRAGLEIAMRPARVMRLGRMKTPRHRMRRFDFGIGSVRCFALDWGELAAIHRSTSVRNIDFFVQRRPDLARLLRLGPAVAALRGLSPVRQRLEAWAARQPEPSPERRRQCRSRLIGFAYDPMGQRAATRVHLPDPYTVTAEIAALALERVVTGPVRAGLHTPVQYLGTEFLGDIPGLPVDWEELELSAPGQIRLRIRRHVPLLQRLRTRGRMGQLVESRASSSGQPRSATPAGAETAGVLHVTAAAKPVCSPGDGQGHPETPESHTAPDGRSDMEDGHDGTDGVRRTGTD